MSNTDNKIWDYCPECGNEEIVNENLLGNGYRVCISCGQEWWTDVDYTGVIRKHIKEWKEANTKTPVSYPSDEKIIENVKRWFALYMGNDTPDNMLKDFKKTIQPLLEVSYPIWVRYKESDQNTFPEPFKVKVCKVLFEDYGPRQDWELKWLYTNKEGIWQHIGKFVAIEYLDENPDPVEVKSDAVE